MYSKVLLFLFIALSNLHSKSIEGWSPGVTYQEVIEHAKKGSPYFQGLLGIFLRSGEFGSSVNIALSKQWSEVSYRNAHPFGSYNLANIAMLEEILPKLLSFIKMQPCCFREKLLTEMPCPCTAWEKSIFR